MIKKPWKTDITELSWATVVLRARLPEIFKFGAVWARNFTIFGVKM